MPKFDVTVYSGLQKDFRLVGTVEAPDRAAAHAAACDRWPNEPPHRLFIQPRTPPGSAQVPPGGPNGVG